MQISTHFNLAEFTRSETALRRGTRVTPDERQLHNLIRLVETVMQPIRDAVGSPIVITSGLRPTWLNTMVGGARDSAHLAGRAADWIAPGRDQAEIWAIVRELDLLMDQCINEFPPNGWIHSAIAPDTRRERREYLTASYNGGRIQYDVA